MARKNLLQGLMDPAASPAPAKSDGETSRVDVTRPRYNSGAIGAVSQSISDLKARAVQEIDVRMIDGGGITDRLENDAGHAELVESLREYGQQVPVLLRPNPNDPERFQIVYGRRRVAALRELGVPVRALVRVLDDRALIVAQGQENSARRDLSFIEKVNFARQMRDMDYSRKVICDALHVDKTLISRMLSVADRIPEPLIHAIGAAPSVGRDRWLSLADLFIDSPLPLEAVVATANAGGETSDARFEALISAIKPGKTAKPPAPQKLAALTTRDGSALAKVQHKGTKLTLTFDQAEGFDEWLVNNLAELHAHWKSGSQD